MCFDGIMLLKMRMKREPHTVVHRFEVEGV